MVRSRQITRQETETSVRTALPALPHPASDGLFMGHTRVPENVTNGRHCATVAHRASSGYFPQPDRQNVTKVATSQIELVAETLEGYAKRGVFKGFSRGPVSRGKATFRIAWHRDRVFELIFDPKTSAMRFPAVLPNVPADSTMYRELKKFIQSRHSTDLPEHRRIDSDRAQVRSFNRADNVSLVLQVNPGDCEYGTRKLIHLVHEIFLTFLVDGYQDYMVETFDLDADRM
jgi:hypothetical protein